MSLIEIVLFFHRYGFILFLVSLAFSWWGRSEAKKGNLAKAIKLVTTAAVCASILGGTYLVIGMISQSAFSFILAALWGYFAWRDWRDLKALKAMSRRR
jgi:hypothetical protein